MSNLPVRTPAFLESTSFRPKLYKVEISMIKQRESFPRAEDQNITKQLMRINPNDRTGEQPTVEQPVNQRSSMFCRRLYLTSKSEWLAVISIKRLEKRLSRGHILFKGQSTGKVRNTIDPRGDRALKQTTLVRLLSD